MLQSHQIEELIAIVSSLDRPALIEQFHNYPAGFPVDFTPEFLQNQPVERLRHIFIAMCLHAQRMPTVPFPTAA